MSNYCVKVVREPLHRVVDDSIDDYTERFYFDSFNEAIDKYSEVCRLGRDNLCSFDVQIIRFILNKEDIILSFHIKVLVVDVLLQHSR